MHRYPLAVVFEATLPVAVFHLVVVWAKSTSEPHHPYKILPPTFSPTDVKAVISSGGNLLPILFITIFRAIKCHESKQINHGYPIPHVVLEGWEAPASQPRDHPSVCHAIHETKLSPRPWGVLCPLFPMGFWQDLHPRYLTYTPDPRSLTWFT